MVTTLAIVGAGPRGLGVLERLIAHRLADPLGAAVTVHLVDPRPLGPGFHRPDQPDHLLLNTVCAQVTAFADERMVDGPTGVRGPSLYEWCRERRLRLASDGYTVLAGDGREIRQGARDIRQGARDIRPNDFLPRRLLAEYLAWAAERVVAAAPPGFHLVRHAATATDIRPRQGGGETVVLDDGTLLEADAVFVTIGHQALHTPAEPPQEPRLITRPYPLPDVLDGIAPGEAVAVLGMGLTAMDVIAALTLGRGGRHEPTADGTGLRYVRSGREPRIVLANRSGMPSRSRPYLNPGRTCPGPLVLTPDRLRALRLTRAGGLLHFTEDVLPLIETEMELAHHRTVLALRTGVGAQAAAAELARRVHRSGPDGALASLRAELGPYPLRGVLTERLTDRPLPDQDAYAAWFTARVRDDLAEARAGLGVSPVKEALEVLRDHRDALRDVIDAPGVDDASLEYFFGAFTSTVNRLVIGPQLDRSAELLALLDAGVLRLGPGPRPKLVAPAGRGPWRLESTCLARPEAVEVDHVVRAHVPEPAPDRLPGSLLAHLVAAGRVTPLSATRTLPAPVAAAAPVAPTAPAAVVGAPPATARGPRVPGLRVTRAGQGVGPDGEVSRTLFFLGPHTEGSSYYNHYVPSPGAPSRALKDAELALRTALQPHTVRTPTTS
ncbi:FAD/NAD(P)-binding protein [Streptomyces sp. TRM64462]|uniref:FAD/NAD(P)-binding protein n=1 Tax=Streptomyces sp. TRM64462 TaxID=2741726 RepID=UPI0015862CBD|nr:FAD/NAD(P)-binding protein [Streptomyces sp. TRM64462]